MPRVQYKCQNCGAIRNSRNKLFVSQSSLSEHEKACSLQEFDDDEFDLIDDDMPDGAFWAMYEEMRNA